MLSDTMEVRMAKLETDVKWIRKSVDDFIKSADSKYANKDKMNDLEDAFSEHCKSEEVKKNNYPVWIAAACAIIAAFISVAVHIK